MLNFLQGMGSSGIAFFERLGRAHLFLFRLLMSLGQLLFKPSLLIKQIHSVGVLTLIIVLVSGLFVGMVIALQTYIAMVVFNAEERVGLVASLSLVRELGPVVAGLLFAGRAGSALAAEIGLMKATEQLSGLEMMAIDPFKRIFAPRFMAGVIAMPLLAIMFSAIGVLGGHLVGVELLGIDSGAFWSQMQAGVDFYGDVINGVIKASVFGVVICWIAIFEGYDCIPTSEGVSRATTRTVVHASLAVLGLDFLLTALMFNV